MLLQLGESRVEPSESLAEGAEALVREALIREARQQARRRHARRALLLVPLVGIAILAWALLGGGASGVIAGTATSPFVNVSGFSHQGELAFISRGRLWVLDGSRGTLRELPTPRGYTPSGPSFSHDGRWLAYLVESTAPNSTAPYQLWFAHADGTGAHRVNGVAVTQFGGSIGWSPAADLMAAGVGSSARAPFGAPTTIDVVSPNGDHRVVIPLSSMRNLRGGALEDAVWSPNGLQLAISTSGTHGTVVSSVAVADPHRSIVWFGIRNSQVLASVSLAGSGPTRSVIADLAGWWRGWGIAFWVYGNGMVHNNDSTPLAVLAKPGVQPRRIANTLSDGITDAVAAGPDGRLAVVDTTSGPGRQYTDGKSVERCLTATQRCSALPGATSWSGHFVQPCPCFSNSPRLGQPGSGVSLDPAWSPNGEYLAYVKAPAMFTARFPGTAWYDDHALYVWDVKTGTTRRIGAIDGASLPTWSSTGQNLLHVSNDGLWMTDVRTGTSVEVEYPLYRERIWNSVGTNFDSPSYYGQIPWSQRFSWYSPR